MKTVITLQTVLNGYIIENKSTGVKEIAKDKNEVANILADRLIGVFKNIDFDSLDIEFETKQTTNEH